MTTNETSTAVRNDDVIVALQYCTSDMTAFCQSEVYSLYKYYNIVNV